MNCQHRDDGRGRCIDCGEFLDTESDELWAARTKLAGDCRSLLRWLEGDESNRLLDLLRQRLTPEDIETLRELAGDA